MIGQVVAGRYQVVESLREGTGLFDSYLAKEVGTGFTVVLKQLRDDWTSPGFLPTLNQTLRGQQKLVHSGVANVLRHGVEDGRLFIVEDFFSRTTLFDAMLQPPPAMSQRLALLRHVINAVGHVHGQGLWHGALTPVNIALRRDHTVKVSDWQIQAQLIEHLAGHDMLPRPSAYFLAPEVLLGKPATAQSDIYSLGCLLYTCLSGWRLPFEKTDMGSLTTLLDENYVPLEKHGIKDPRWDEVVRRCLATDPAARYASVVQLARDLKDMLGEAPATTTATAGGSPPRRAAAPAPVRGKRRLSWWRMMHGSVATLLGFSVLVLISFVGFMVFQRGPKGTSYYDFFMELLSPTAPVQVMDVKGAEVEQAREALARQNLELRVLGTIPKENLPENVILTQDPRAGKLVKPPRTVGVYVSGAVKRLKVPAVTGKTWEEAWRQLHQLGLAVNSEPSYSPSEEVPFNHVLAQTPAAGEEVDPGTEAKLVLSAGVKEKPKPSPNLIGQTLGEARQVLGRSGLPVFANVYYYSQEPRDVVIGQFPLPGQPMDEQLPFTLEVSRGLYQAGLYEATRTLKVQVQGLSEVPSLVRVLYEDANGEHLALEGKYTHTDFDVVDIQATGETQLILEVDGSVLYRKRL